MSDTTPYLREFLFLDDPELCGIRTTISGSHLAWYFIVEGLTPELGRVDQVRKLTTKLDPHMMSLSDAAISGDRVAARELTALVVAGRA